MPVTSEKNILFSVVIPLYNRAHLITKTIDSFLKQEYSDFELLIIDDGSNDNPLPVIQSINDDRIKYFRIENSERGYARNFGTRHSKGDYINFFDSDDVAFPNHLMEALKVISENNYPEMFCLGYRIKSSEGKIIKVYDDYNTKLNVRLFTEGNVLSCNPVFLRHDVALNFPFDNDRRMAGSEDAVLWMKLSARYPWNYSNIITSELIQHDERSVINMNKDKLIERLKLFYNAVSTDDMIRKKYSRLLNYVKLEYCSYIALHLALTRQYKMPALKWWIFSVAAHPVFLLRKRCYVVLKLLIF